MKTRSGFVSNSSNSSFILSKDSDWTETSVRLESCDEPGYPSLSSIVLEAAKLTSLVKELEAERDSWKERAEKAEAALAGRTAERDRARAYIDARRLDGTLDALLVMRTGEAEYDAALADEPEVER
jgi:hypothetical protein